MPTPADADPALFRQLKQALSAMLASGGVKTTSAPPTSPASQVNDFDITTDQDTVTFSWTYRNPGDYNLDGEAGLADLAVLGRHLGKGQDSPDWDEAQAADGDGNGLITLADLTPLGGNLMGLIEGYRLRYTATPQDSGSWQTLVDVLLSEAVEVDGKLRFSVTRNAGDLPTDLVYYEVVPFQGSQLGLSSNSQTLMAAPPAIGGVSPLAGAAGDQVTFSADVFGDEPLQFAWDFGGAASPNNSDERTPTVTLTDDGGSFTGTLVVTNAVGDDNFQFVINVSSNVPPTASLQATPGSGPSPLTVVLSAEGSSDPDGTLVRYEFDPQGDGSYDISGPNATTTFTYSQAGTFNPGLRVTDDQGATATGSTTVTVAAIPVAAVTVNTSQVVAPNHVSYDASQSSSPNGKIVKFEWDWDGNGIFDADTADNPRTRILVDGPKGTYESVVRITDSTGAQASAIVEIFVVEVTFVPPPPEVFISKSKPGDSATTKWLKDVYSTLPEWRDANGPYQSAWFANWANEVFNLINAERANAGLPALIRDPHLDLVSQAHERDQALRNFYSHYSIEGLTPETRPKAVSNRVIDWGEIIGLGQESPVEVVSQWMNSPGHRMVIMNGSVTHAGVGVYHKTGAPQGDENYWGVQFGKFTVDPETDDWLEPHEVQ